MAPDIRPQVEAELAAEHERIAGGVDKAVEIGVVDEVVEPSATRSALARAIAAAAWCTAARTATSRSDRFVCDRPAARSTRIADESGQRRH